MSLMQGLPPEKQGQNINLIIAHWCMFAPGKSGMYETVKELVLEELKMPGVMAGIVEPDNKKGGKSDGWITTQSHGWAMEAPDIHVSHWYMKGYSTMQRPRVMMIHGTPEACYEAEGKSGSFTACINGINNLDAAIVFAKRHYWFWKQYDDRDILYRIDKGVDLTRYVPRGMLIDLDGKPKVGIGEIQRLGGVKLPLLPYCAINEVYKQNEEIRLHQWGVGDERKILDIIMHKSNFDKFLGKYGLMGQQMFPTNWYRGCDMLISPSQYGEPSRVNLESMACGTPVIDWGSNPFQDSYATFHAKPFDAVDMAECIMKIWDSTRANPEKVKRETRAIAEQHYGAKRMAEQTVQILREVLAKT